MRIVLILEYNGSDYCGWQSQPLGCSIQDKLEFALSQVANEKIHVVTAGRTDAGVHALYQVAHFDTSAKRPLTAWIRGVNAFLPKDIAVLWANKISGHFHARFSARARCYQYLLLNHPIRPGIHSQKVGWFHQPLDLKKMQDSSRILIGEHDFSAFRAAECQAKSPVRTLTRLDISCRGNIIIFDLCANAFLHHMVRNIVGCLLYIGKGKHSPDWIQTLLESCDRTSAPPTFSATGLYLTGIEYDPEWNLPQINEKSIFNDYPRIK
ncbi:MAG: tRNA pseudouridine(38-40) synthase TruA [Burkholderiales bacterium]|nr:tRNA pseudouridine(38-40) synthase TruA [Nitrosomonas sp.]MCP5273743.1 tRNA pseudouridine(38-40) synthase TruA [Burkholderiales bacterium]